MKANQIHSCGYHCMLPSCVEATRKKRDALEAENAKLKGFARDILADWPETAPDEPEIQDLAIKHGLLVAKAVKPTEPCGEDCACAEYFTEREWAEGVECFERVAFIKEGV